MSTLYITEYASEGLARGAYLPVPQEPPVAEQTVAIGAGSTQSAVLNAKTALVRVHTDATCSVAYGPNPTASATSGRMAANTTEYVAIDRQRGADSLFKVAVIANT